MPESKFYAVRLGHTPGIYHSWPDCLDQVRGFKGAVCKSGLSVCYCTIANALP